MPKKIKGNNVLALVMIIFSLFSINNYLGQEKNKSQINIFMSVQIIDASSDKTIISIRGAVSLNVPKTKKNIFSSPKNNNYNLKNKKMRTKQSAYQLSNRRRRTFRYWHGAISQK